MGRFAVAACVMQAVCMSLASQNILQMDESQDMSGYKMLPEGGAKEPLAEEKKDEDPPPSAGVELAQGAAAEEEAPKESIKYTKLADVQDDTVEHEYPGLVGEWSQSKTPEDDAPFSVDVVYTWVDGADLAWRDLRKEEMKYSDSHHEQADSNAVFRYRQRDELKFSMRSLAKHAPWVNHIYIVVCCGQRPSWLGSSDSVTIVEHSSLFSSSDELPTFNSFAIETVVDKIPGLTEQFLMLNDDMLFGQDVALSDFFTDEGKPIVRFETAWSPMLKTRPQSASVDAYIVAGSNVNKLLTEKYGDMTRHMVQHQAYPLTKSLYARAKDLYGSEFSDTESHKFRDNSDIIPHFLALYVGMYEQKAVNGGDDSGAPTSKVIALTDDVQAAEAALQGIVQDTPKLLCLGDKATKEKSMEALDMLFDRYLTELLPDVSEFEEGFQADAKAISEAKQASELGQQNTEHVPAPASSIPTLAV